MVDRVEHRQRRVLRTLSGEERGAGAAILRAALRVVEPAYAAAMAARNALYGAGVLAVRPLGRPVVSVGNMTTGGTGKTPVVQWLIKRLREAGFRPAVLMRGYKAAGGMSDERELLDRELNADLAGGEPRVVVHAEANRVRGAAAVLRERPDVDVFVLDDGFQHRRAARDFDLVLVNAVEPFGYGHVLPRGLLREPLAGLRRAEAVVITRADEVGAERLAEIEARVRRHNSSAPIFRADHVHTGVRAADAGHRVEQLKARRALVFCGIGSPEGLVRKLEGYGATCVGRRWFPDHHAYTAADVDGLKREAAAAGADVLVTTEKDWVKIERIPAARGGAIPIWRLALEVRFQGDGGEELLRRVREAIGRRR